MKKFKFLWTLVALPLLASCSQDDLPNSGPGNEPESGKDGFYMSVSFKPVGGNGTRSTTSGNNTSSDGKEVGTDAENKVSNALIVLATPDNKMIASAMAPNGNNKGKLTASNSADAILYNAIAQFNKTTLATYYTTYKNDANLGKINVYVFCNPTADLKTKMEGAAVGSTDWINFEWTYKAPYTDENDVITVPETIWDDNKFTMSNLAKAERELPKSIDDWTTHNTVNNAFNLSGNNNTNGNGVNNGVSNGRGPIEVHRMAARLDFKDGATALDEDNNVIPFTYNVIENANNEVIVNCKIYRMALSNMSKTQYYLGRVSDNGLLTGAHYELCGPEKAWPNGNYVVSTYADKKAENNKGIMTGFSDYFVYPFFNPSGIVQSAGDGWDWISCADVVDNTDNKYPEDNYGTTHQYHRWRYLTENTIPSPSSLQINSQSTGIIFKARMQPTEKLNDTSSDKWEKMLYVALNYDTDDSKYGNLLYHNLNLDPIIYSVNGTSVYITWGNLQAAALKEAGWEDGAATQNLTRTSALYRLVYGSGGFGTFEGVTDGLAQDEYSLNSLWEAWESARQSDIANATDLDDIEESLAAETARIAFKKAATEAGIYLYQSSQDPDTNEWGYYCYYYYWNRHNDNGNPTTMNPMEFAVVRNNVYKLAVTKISKLGHPRIPENDPDDPKPDTPDESSDVYLELSVEVIPWVVRLNDIEF